MNRKLEELKRGDVLSDLLKLFPDIQEIVEKGVIVEDFDI